MERPCTDSIGPVWDRPLPETGILVQKGRRRPKARETVLLTKFSSYGRRGETKFRTTFFAKLSFKKAGVGWNFSDFVLYYLLQFFRKHHFPT